MLVNLKRAGRLDHSNTQESLKKWYQTSNSCESRKCRVRETPLFLSRVFVVAELYGGFPRTAGWALRQWLKHPRNLTSKCVTGCQCLYTWRRLVERIRITGRARDSLSRVRAGTHVPTLPRRGETSVYFDIGRRDFTPGYTNKRHFLISRYIALSDCYATCSDKFSTRITSITKKE